MSTEQNPAVAALPVHPGANDLTDRTFPRTPFVPASKALRDERCEEILSLQATGLATRLRHTHAKTAVVGLSGGLDSTLALIVLVHAFDMLGLDRKGILAVTMPCFGTTARTKGNAEKLADAYGVTLETVDIKAAVDQHFSDIGQSKDDLSVTFENGQARMRTLVLMNLANKTGGMVVGTGDLSELALGWATYNGDHMSMYGVNASIPKTLVRYLVAYEADRSDGRAVGRAVRCARHPGRLPSCCRPRTARSARRPRIWSARTSCTTFSCIICCASAIRRARSTASRAKPLRVCTTTRRSKSGS